MPVYSESERQAALDCLAANNGNFRTAASQTGISESTLRRWATPITENTPRQALDALRDSFMQLQQVQRYDTTNPAETHLNTWLRQTLPHSLIDGAVQLLDTLAEGIDEAPLSQRVAALKYFTDTLFRLMQLMPMNEKAVIRVEFLDPDDHTTDTAPYWAREDSAE